MSFREDFSSISMRSTSEGTVVTVSILFDGDHKPYNNFQEGSPMHYIAKNMVRLQQIREGKD